MDWSAGTVIDGRYVVRRPLGRGGMATVWLVQHRTLHTLHALKVLRLPAASLGERLLREGRVQAALQHPNVVRVSDLIEVQGSPGLLLEYVDGPSLKDLLAHRRLSASEADVLFRGIARGVAAAHRAGLVHRDLKPANILLQPVPGGVVPKVTDFGLAKALGLGVGSGDSLQTRSGAFLGTPAYMAPEQIRDARNVDHRADLFSLGAIAYELLTGARAFEGADAAEVMTRVKQADYAPIEADVPPSMREAVAAALQPDPDARPQTVEALLELWARDQGLLHGAGDSWVLDVAQLREDGAEIVPVDIPDTWVAALSASGSSNTESTYAEPMTRVEPPPPARPQRSLLVPVAAGAALFLSGIAVAVLLQPSASAPPPAPVPIVAGASEAQLALQRLNLDMADIGTDAISGRKDLDWLRHELPRMLEEREQAGLRILERWPDDEVVLGARFQLGMVRYQGYAQRAWVVPPAGVSAEERELWTRVIEEELKPAAWEDLDAARAIFAELAASDHPAAELSPWTRSARTMQASIDQIQRPQ